MSPRQQRLSVLTIGSAARDVFLISKHFGRVEYEDEEHVILPAEEKIDVPDIASDVGGGAVNAAISFARLGVRVGCLAKIGADGSGNEIARVLKDEKVLDYLVIDKTHQTGSSVILKGPKGEDTILSHRGAGYEYSRSSFAHELPDADWVYVSSLGGAIDILGEVVHQAALQGSRIAVNPGMLEIEKKQKLLKILKSVDVVIMNQPEAEALFGSDDPMVCFQAARAAGLHTIVITLGKNGSIVLDGSYVYKARLFKHVPIIDQTGAGDAYGAGLIAAIAAGRSMQEAMSYASANATNVISYIGARAGILRGPEVDMMNISVSIFE
ncbi:MAG: carbohydrate kinase family protein [bacterium]